MAKNYMDVYDQMSRGDTSGVGTLNKKAIANVPPKGGKDFVKCQEAYDQIFSTAPKTVAPSQKVVLSEENLREIRLRRMGAAQCIKERLAQGFSTNEIDQLISDIRDIIESV